MLTSVGRKMFSPEQTESFMKEAIAEAMKSQAEDAGPHPKVGAILVDRAALIEAR
jgi:pyrimidine deaminase RibD-like protein